MSKYSSFKSHQLITEDWRKFLSESGEEWYGWQESKLGKARKNPKPEEKKESGEDEAKEEKNLSVYQDVQADQEER